MVFLVLGRTSDQRNFFHMFPTKGFLFSRKITFFAVNVVLTPDLPGVFLSPHHAISSLMFSIKPPKIISCTRLISEYKSKVG